MKEKIEKLLKSHLKRKLTITTATLIAFLLSSNLAMAGQGYQVGNGKIERYGKDATEYLGNDKTGLFEISETNIVNRLKDESWFTLLAEVNKPFVNEGRIWELINNGTEKIENRGYINVLNSTKPNEIENRGYIHTSTSKGNIANKGFISELKKANNIVNDGYIDELNENKNITNNGIIRDVKNGAHIAGIEGIKNNGIIYFQGSAYDTLKNNGKLINKGIVRNDLTNFVASATDDIGREIKNYKPDEVITESEINNKIFNAYNGKIENNLEVKNNSILNMFEGRIAKNKKISIDNSTANIGYLSYYNGLELEFKNNSKIGALSLTAPFGIEISVIRSITIDNTTEVGDIKVSSGIEVINLVPNTDIANKDKVLRINNFEIEFSKNVNTYISTNVDLLRRADLGNITVEKGGRLTIAGDALKYNGRENDWIDGELVLKYYRKDITVEKGGKIIIGIDPYNIGEIEKLGDGNNLTESVIGQVDTADPNLRLAQDKLTIDTDSLLHDVVVLDGEEVNYVGLGKRRLKNRYKLIEELKLPEPPVTPPSSGGTTNPPSGGTPNPPSGGTPNPPSGGTPNPPSGGTPNPPSGGTPNPPSGGTPNPPSGGTPNPPSGGTTTPPSSVPPDYGKLNDGYEVLQKAGKIKELSVYNTAQLFGLYEYLRDMYANSPYALSGETSFKNLAMLRDNAYLDLKPNLNKWAVMGGLSHSDRENKFKHELGTTEADTITTGAYAKGEYGLKEDTTLGLILGGTNSKSDLLTGKVKGSSIYLGAYAKKYVNNFKFTLGTGIDLGEYKVERNAIGYAGIIETEKYSAKQKNRAFDLYAEARYSKDLGNNFYLEPNFNLAYSRVRQGSATENDGKINLDIKSKTFNQTTAALGLDLKKVLLNGNTSHSFALGTAYERLLSGAKENSIRANLVGESGSGFDILVPEKEKGRTSIGAEYKLENKVGILFNLKMDYGFKHGSDKKDIRFSTGLGYRF